MTKTVPLDEYTHKLLKRVQTNLYDKFNIEISILDIIKFSIPDNDDEMIRRVIENIRVEKTNKTELKLDS